MATITLRPNGTAEFGSYVVTGAATAHEATDEITADDATTYVTPDAESGFVLLFDDMPSGATIQDIRLYYRFSIPSGSRNIYVVLGDSALNSYFADFVTVSGSWQTRDSGVISINPLTGVAFTEAEINDIVVYLGTTETTARPQYTQTYLVVNYTTSSQSNSLLFAGD